MPIAKLRACAGVLSCGLALVLPCAAQARRDLVVRSFDGTPIVTHFFPAAGLAPGGQAPTVLLGHGWGRPGTTDPEETGEGLARTSQSRLRHSGYNTVTWDPRGFGGSGDQVRFDAPDFEARDIQAVIDAISHQPEALLDAPGDPRVGMAGASYGGGIQLVAAALDRRIDAIAPSAAWHSLVTAFYKDATLKTGWMLPVCTTGSYSALLAGLLSPAGPQLGGLDRHVYDLCTAALSTGVLRDETVSWLASRGPGPGYVGRVRAPTLLLHATSDTLITLAEAISNYGILVADGVPVRMMWFCQGHGTCPTNDGPGEYVERAVLAWFARWLKRDPDVELGARFEWLDQTGRWWSAPRYPSRRIGQIAGEGAGSLSLTVADSARSGTPFKATPSRQALSLDLPATSGDAYVVGEPELELTYVGEASERVTSVFAQIVDVRRGIVAGHQVTPIRLVLDGRTHTARRPLEALAQHVTPESRYRLQLLGGTQVYDAQRAVGRVRFTRIAIALPLVAQTPPVAGTRARARRRGAARAVRRARAQRRGVKRAARPPGRRSRAR